jgi:uncharacterized protein with HEPN domain
MYSSDCDNLEDILESIEKIYRYTVLFDNADDFYCSSLHFDAVMMNFRRNPTICYFSVRKQKLN